MPEFNSNPEIHAGHVSSLKKLNALFARPWFAYLTLVLFQLKVIWGIWKYHDLTGGDTSGYFNRAYLWFNNFQVDIIWSPLYTAFYGSLLYLSRDAYVVTTLHRVIIIFTLCVLVLCLMHKLLPAPIAWLIAAWWCVLPIDFNSLYEVHIFTVILILAAYLVILSSPSPWARGSSIAIIAASAVLMRNELSVSAVVLSAACLCYEIREWKKRKREMGEKPDFRRLCAAYGIPLIFAVLLCGFFYSRSIIKFPALLGGGRPKHTLNMGQVYAFGYQQRHPEWTQSPWTDFDELNQRIFGKPSVSLGEMIERNPRAIFANMWWNVKLAPSGIQLLLFNSISGGITPDYIPVRSHAPEALPLSILAGAIWLAGLALLYRERAYWWNSWLKQRLHGWLAMVSVASVAPLIILTQRPRPSYLFSLSILLMAFTGMCIFVICNRWPGLRRLSALMPAVMILAPVFIPSYYLQFDRDKALGLLNFYRRLAPYHEIIGQPANKFLVGGYDIDIQGYIIHQYTAPKIPQIIDYSLFQKMPADMPVGEFLDQNAISLFFLDENLWQQFEANPVRKQFLASPEAAGWERIGEERHGTVRWMLLIHNPAVAHEAAATGK